MVNCASCGEQIYSERELMDRVQLEDYDDYVDGFSCIYTECKKCSYVNTIYLKTEISIVSLEVD